MDPVKFPAESALPSNAKFLNHNVLTPFPKELHGTFDFVHVRLLIVALKAGDWEIALRNLHQLLKPGSWLLWEEMANISLRSFPPSHAFDEWIRIGGLQTQKHGLDPL
jgi:chemotaxis methyl-accepting protein methylase